MTDPLDALSHRGWRRRSFRRDPGTITMAMMIGGGALAAGGKVLSGWQAKEEGKVAQQNSVTLAAEQQATAQRRAFADADKARLIEGRATAAGAASGAPTGMTIADIAGGIKGRGDANVAAATAEGTRQASMTRYAGDLAKKRGANAFAGSLLDAGATGLTTAGRIGARYGFPGSGSSDYEDDID